jgi:5-methylcytosine-specific restriction enzyme A
VGRCLYRTRKRTDVEEEKMTDRRSISQSRREAILKRQNDACAVCGCALRGGRFEIDHTQALVHGGDNDDDNLRALCPRCHRVKTKEDVRGDAHAGRVYVGGKQRKGPPLPGTKASGIRKRFNGTVERWR